MSCEQCHYQQFRRAHAFRQLSRETGLGINVQDPSSHGAAKLELCLFVSALTDASVGDSGLLDHRKPIFQKGLATPMEMHERLPEAISKAARAVGRCEAAWNVVSFRVWRLSLTLRDLRVRSPW